MTILSLSYILIKVLTVDLFFVLGSAARLLGPLAAAPLYKHGDASILFLGAGIGAGISWFLLISPMVFAEADRHAKAEADIQRESLLANDSVGNYSGENSSDDDNHIINDSGDETESELTR